MVRPKVRSAKVPTHLRTIARVALSHRVSRHNSSVNARFYAPDAHAPGDLVALPDEEAEHLTRVLRLKAGDAIRVFNGRGNEFDAVVDHAGKRGVHVRLGSAAQAAPEPRVAITLAQA